MSLLIKLSGKSYPHNKYVAKQYMAQNEKFRKLIVIERVATS